MFCAWSSTLYIGAASINFLYVRKAVTKMNLNVDTFIKQEFLSAEEELMKSVSNMDVNIPVKNEPIMDETFPLETIKIETFNEDAIPEDAVTIKSENCFQNPETITKHKDSFIIYELEKPTVQNPPPALLPQPVQHIFKEISPAVPEICSPNIAQNKQIVNTKKPTWNSNSNQNNVKNTNGSHISDSTVSTPPPVLLNSQLRKRHKVISSMNPIDKRTRYNIERTTPVLADEGDAAADPIETSNTSRLLNTGIKKIINHIIKYKRKQRTIEENSLPNTSNPKSIEIEYLIASTVKEQTLNTVSTNCFHKTAQRAAAMPNVSNVSNTFTPTASLPSQIIQDSPNQSTDAITMPELRVKCLCSLTENTTTDNTELKEFFKEMYDETRCLNRAQQRNIKMLLLKTISDAQESVEQGKCCGF